MAGTGLQVRDKILSVHKGLYRGMICIVDGLLSSNHPRDAAQFNVVTGGNNVVDIPATAGTYVLIYPGEIPKGTAIAIRALRYYVTGPTAWAGGTAGNVSVSLQGTDGTVLVTFTQAALTGSASDAAPTSGSIVPGSTPATGITDNVIRTIKNHLASGVGLQVVVSNSTSGSPLRLDLSGFFVSV